MSVILHKLTDFSTYKWYGLWGAGQRRRNRRLAAGDCLIRPRCFILARASRGLFASPWASMALYWRHSSCEQLSDQGTLGQLDGIGMALGSVQEIDHLARLGLLGFHLTSRKICPNNWDHLYQILLVNVLFAAADFCLPTTDRKTSTYFNARFSHWNLFTT